MPSVGQRVLRAALTLLAVSILTFALTALLPGDPALTILGPTATPQALAKVRADMHLNDPLPSRYATWITNAVQGDLGTSYGSGRSVSSQIGQALPITLEIVFIAMLLSLALAIPIGMLCAHRAGSSVDRAASGAMFGLLAVPSLVAGIILVLVFAIWLHWLPPAGWTNFSDDPVDNLRRALLPALALALPQIAIFSRLLRGDMRATLDQDYVAFADSKGLSTRRVLFGHALRPSSFSLLTYAGLAVGFLISTGVVIERLFNIPGMGSLIVQAINERDLVLVQGVTLVVATVFVVINLVVDLLYAVLDPRIRRHHVDTTS